MGNPRHELSEEEMEWMRLPRRFWSIRPDMIEAGMMRTKTMAFISKLEMAIENGYGLIFCGPNGVGKTSAAVSILMEARRQTFKVLFMEAAKIKAHAIDRDRFDDRLTMWQYAHSCDLLLLDDVGKGTTDGKGFGEGLLDELLRHRSANLRSTLLTTNLPITNLDGALNASTQESLKETTLRIPCTGRNWRDGATASLKSFFD